jgi:hypothetical protein
VTDGKAPALDDGPGRHVLREPSTNATSFGIGLVGSR